MRYTFKLIIAGDGGVGKTTLVDRYTSGTFHEDIRMTLGVQFMVNRLMVDRNNVELQIWDFCGEDRFQFILPAYCRGAHGAIFAYDITNPASLFHAGKWIQLLWGRNGEYPIIVAGTKADLESARKIRESEARGIVGQHEISELIEISSKTGQNVLLLFEKICHAMINAIPFASK